MKEKIWKVFAGIWLGKIVFFSFVIAPTIFQVLEKPLAAILQNKLFPLYYSVGIACGLILFLLDLTRGKKKIAALALAIAIGVIGITVLSPMIREAFLTQSENMKWLHPLAVGLNLLQLIAVIFSI